MPGVIDPETLHVDNLPTIWSPIQWELTPEEKAAELEEQATASLLWAADTPEAMLRLALGEAAILRVFDPPDGYNPQEQGAWDEALVTFAFERRIRLEEVRREQNHLQVVYKFDNLGFWQVDFTPEKITIERL